MLALMRRTAAKGACDLLNLPAAKQRLNLALEGGGAHGAFTWGVLDRLLEDETLEHRLDQRHQRRRRQCRGAWPRGLPRAAAPGARAKLRAVWEAVAKAGVPDLLRLNPLARRASAARNALAQVATLFSPYDFNPLGFDPFRKLLEAHIDFALLRTTPGPELLIAATDVATGRPRLFRRREITVRVGAGLGLPAHPAPRRDHRRAAPTGTAASRPTPTSLTLARESPVADTLIVKLNPLDSKGVPTSAREITARINQITFSQPMLRDIEVIETVRAHRLALVARRRARPTRASPAIAST